MTDTVQCRRCGRLAAALAASPPLPAELAHEVMGAVCAGCWKDWEEMEVMVINEHRLNFMDPEAPAILHRHLRDFLALDSPGGD